MSANFPVPNVTLDVSGASCPGPILEAKRLINSLVDGQILLLISDCPGTEADLFAWSRITGNQIVATERRSEKNQGYYVRKGGAARPMSNASLDLRGVVCPGPIVEAKKLLNSMQVGEVLRLVSDCPGVKDDIGGWTLRTGLELIASSEIAAGEYEFFIAKRQ